MIACAVMSLSFISDEGKGDCEDVQEGAAYDGERDGRDDVFDDILRGLIHVGVWV